MKALDGKINQKQHSDRRKSFFRSLVLPNDVQAVPQLNQFVDEICDSVDLDPAQTMQMNLAIEEAVVNVMNYAYPADVHGDVNIDVQGNDEQLEFIISDSGIPFDPTAREKVDTTLPLEDRPIGGLGIFLVRELMDSIHYKRVDGKNVLTLCKKLDCMSNKTS